MSVHYITLIRHFAIETYAFNLLYEVSNSIRWKLFFNQSILFRIRRKCDWIFWLTEKLNYSSNTYHCACMYSWNTKLNRKNRTLLKLYIQSITTQRDSNNAILHINWQYIRPGKFKKALFTGQNALTSFLNALLCLFI